MWMELTATVRCYCCVDIILKILLVCCGCEISGGSNNKSMCENWLQGNNKSTDVCYKIVIIKKKNIKSRMKSQRKRK